MNNYQKTLKNNENIYLTRLSKISGEKRIEIASELHEAVKEISKAGIKHQNPHISPSALNKELLKRFNK